MIFPIEIPKRAQICAKGQEPLEPGKIYYSVLQDGHLRQDFCAACWETISLDESFLRSKIYWKSKIPLKHKEPTLPKDRDERALVLLKQATDQSEAFVLALYLARKRMIALRKEFKDENGQIQQVYEVLETEEMICVPKVPLSNLQTQQIQIQIAQKLSA